MSFLTPMILVFSILGALDYLLGNRFGLGAEFKKAFSLAETIVFVIVTAILIAAATPLITRKIVNI